MRANTYRESLETVLARCSLLGAERVFFRECMGRVLAQNLTAQRDDPPAPKSAMDGFALRAADTAKSTKKRPVRFTFDEVVGAGHQAQGTVTAGGAIRVMTGALLPEGADAVVKQEDTVSQKPARAANPGTSGRFAVTAPLAPGENVFPTGYRFARDDVLVPAGISLNAQALGLFAGEGHEDVRVFRRPLDLTNSCTRSKKVAVRIYSMRIVWTIQEKSTESRPYTISISGTLSWKMVISPRAVMAARGFMYLHLEIWSSHFLAHSIRMAIATK